ncbi:MAG TPA: PQQ-binding-like beta-propeller repeat protein [Phycisphaerae bacterium]|nr:PQQ-binding-like beta-propeller repeat protein [Phycisphaerae bacterium]
MRPSFEFAPALLVTISMLASARAQTAGADPWPVWQRTASRLGRTTTIGPRTPTVAWKLRIDDTNWESGLESSAALDAQGRLFVGVHEQVTCVDTVNREVLWGFYTYDPVLSTPAVSEGRVLFGTTSGDNATFYCVTADTGDELWSFFIPGGRVNSSPVVDDLVVYFSSGDVIYARSVEDGSEVWTRDMSGVIIYTSPSLDGLGRLFNGGAASYFAFDVADGGTTWEFPLDAFPRGTGAVESGRLYLSTRGGPFSRLVYCINAQTSSEIWRFEDSPRDLTGTVALGHPDVGRVYALASIDWLFCLDGRDGSEVWRLNRASGLCKSGAIVDGSETIYFGVATTGKRVCAVRPDGTELWTYPMPERVFPSPLLAPDGTLYVICSDKYLYAFHDPPNLDKTDGGEQAEPTQVHPVPPP